MTPLIILAVIAEVFAGAYLIDYWREREEPAAYQIFTFILTIILCIFTIKGL
jgi:hypothetical protein